MSLKSAGRKKQRRKPPGVGQGQDVLPECEKAVAAANGYMIREYPLGVLGGPARRLTLNGTPVWIVPIFLTSPGYGPVGEVGLIAVDARTREIVGSTPRAEVVDAGKRLCEEKRDDLQAAFLRARGNLHLRPRMSPHDTGQP
jgi:hypothetical protein